MRLIKSSPSNGVRLNLETKTPDRIDDFPAVTCRSSSGTVQCISIDRTEIDLLWIARLRAVTCDLLKGQPEPQIPHKSCLLMRDRMCAYALWCVISLWFSTKPFDHLVLLINSLLFYPPPPPWCSSFSLCVGHNQFSYNACACAAVHKLSFY